MKIQVQSNYMSIPFADMLRIRGWRHVCVEGCVSGLTRSVMLPTPLQYHYKLDCLNMSHGESRFVTKSEAHQTVLPT